MNYGRDRHPPKGRGSNYERKQWCARCDRRTTHLYDHGEGMHLCTVCDLGNGDDDPQDPYHR